LDRPLDTDALLGVYERDLTIASGKGVRLTDAEGRSYLDFAAGIAVNGLGYGDRKVLAAIKDQAGKLIHASNLFHNEPAARLARKLVDVSFPAKVFFGNSGTEVTEAALKFARKIGKPQGRFELVSFERSFHGRTLGALSLTWTAKYREPFEPLVPGVKFARYGDLASLEAVIGDRTAAVFVEPVQGEGGIHVATTDFMQGLQKLCRERGALLISDEIQCGLGRTGRICAYQHTGIEPDMLVLAKPLGGGLPLGAVLLRETLAHHLAPGDHGSTFGGNPVACAAGLAVLDRIADPAFLDKVARSGDELRRGLKRIAKALPGRIAEVRGLGLMWGVELTGEAKPVLAALRSRGVLATRAGDRVIRLLPPLVVKPVEVREFLAAFEAVLGETTPTPGM
jgi:acetylornithine/N-succinyldiaminopimelate aminotransferase